MFEQWRHSKHEKENNDELFPHGGVHCMVCPRIFAREVIVSVSTESSIPREIH